MSAPQRRSNKLWAYGETVKFNDAYGRNPVKGKIIRFYNEYEVLVEDTRGVTHYGGTDRIVGDPKSKADLFDDLLGDPAPARPAAPFEDLLG